MSKRRKKLNLELHDKLREEVDYLEKLLIFTINSIWADDDVIYKYKKIMELEIDERRLYLVYILMDEKIIKTAKYFDINRKIVSAVINEIKNKLI